VTEPRAAAAPAEPDDSAGGRRRLPARVDRLVLPIAFAVMIVIFAAAKPEIFLTWQNVTAILDQAVVLAILGAGLTIVLITGDFDLSLTGTVGLSGTLGVLTMTRLDGSWWTAILVAIAVGTCFGALNGWLVAYLGGEAFIVTLAVGTIVAGIELAILDGKTIYEGLDPNYAELAVTDVAGGVSLFVFVGLAIVALAWLLTECTKFGRGIHALGSNRTAAANAGVRIRRNRFAAFTIMGALAGVCGAIITSRSGSAFPGAGDGLLVQPYAATFLGASLTRRRFHPAATFLGVLFMGVLATGLVMTGQKGWVTQVITGAVLVAAVVIAGRQLKRPPWMDRVFNRAQPEPSA
jgi:ribose transport system permease protein